MNTQELTQIATAHQQAISRHEQEMAEIRAIFLEGSRRQEQAMARHEEAMARHEEAIAQHDREIADIRARQEEASAQHDREMVAIRAQQQLNVEGIADLKGSIQELRNLVADYLQGRSQL